MDLKFPDPNVVKVAQTGDEKWLIYPDCINAWEYASDRDALVECLLCKQMMQNPRYSNETFHTEY